MYIINVSVSVSGRSKAEEAVAQFRVEREPL